jgi:hypothetical protein
VSPKCCATLQQPAGDISAPVVQGSRGTTEGRGYQSPSFKVDHREALDLRRQTETTTVKDPHTRIKPLALASGHGRDITVTPERALVSVEELPLHITHKRHKLVTVSLPKLFRNGRFASETAVRRFQKQNGHLDPEVVLKYPRSNFEETLCIIVFQGGDDGRGYRICIKHPEGPT